MARSMADALTFLSHFSVFAFEKYPKSINYQKFFTFKESLVATFNEKYALTSRKYVVEQDKTCQIYRSHFIVFGCTSPFLL